MAEELMLEGRSDEERRREEDKEKKGEHQGGREGGSCVNPVNTVNYYTPH